MAELGFEPGAAGWEARMLPLCYAAPHDRYFLNTQVFHRHDDFRCSVVFKDAGIDAEETTVTGFNFGAKIEKPVVGSDFVKFPIREHNYEDCSVAFYRSMRFLVPKMRHSNGSPSVLAGSTGPR